MPGIPRISIEQQMAAIGVNTTPAQLSITSPRPQMKVNNTPPEMDFTQETPEFTVNWKQVRNESGLKNPNALTLSLRDSAKIQVTEYISGQVASGDYLGRVETPGNRVANEARGKNMETAQKDINLGTMPQSLPQVSWDPGEIDINWTNHQFKIQWEGEYMPEVKLEPPYSVEIFLRDKPYIRISVEEMQDARYM